MNVHDIANTLSDLFQNTYEFMRDNDFSAVDSFAHSLTIVTLYKNTLIELAKEYKDEPV